MTKKDKKASQSGADIEEPLPETVERSALMHSNRDEADLDVAFELELDDAEMGAAISEALADAEGAMADSGSSHGGDESSDGPEHDLPDIEDLFLLDDESDGDLVAPESQDDDMETLEGHVLGPLSRPTEDREVSEASEFAVPAALLDKMRSGSANDTSAETREVDPLVASPSDETVQNAVSRLSQDSSGLGEEIANFETAERSFQTLDVPLEAIQVSEVFQDPGINIMPSFDEEPSQEEGNEEETGQPIDGADSSGEEVVELHLDLEPIVDNDPVSLVFDAIVSDEGSVLIPPDALDEGALEPGHLVQVTLTKLPKTHE